ncbi:MAG: small ribosomal subunit biogenesis GTPase RsgA [Cyanobacteria bacterium REEB459]|nr:small ribosomal subunit biogenesis GTPase RsgA [Cyanobacteria bacterium REEB459]
MGVVLSSRSQLPPGLWGVVTAVQANFYRVQLGGQPCPGESGLPPLLCTRRARLKKIGQQVMVGDWVEVVDPDWEGQRGAISAVHPRQTMLDRPAIANVDQILLVFALAEPGLDPWQLSRFLVKAESTGLDVGICLNKQDLVAPETVNRWQLRLQQWGYSPLVLSLHPPPQQTPLVAYLQGKTTVICGPSGVGKSSLINHLIPRAKLRTGAVSGRLGRGRHTTRHVELLELEPEGFLADTPGFNQPDLTLPPEELAFCFPEVRQYFQNHNLCQFSNCLHRDEPGCALGTTWDRYPFYVALLTELITIRDSPQRRQPGEVALKTKTKPMGTTHQEPLLEPKKHRRLSRRRQNQDLADHLDDLSRS